jgi:two-component system, NarL family, response regulator NreC
MVIRVLLADDHKIVRQGIRSLLERQQDIEVVAEAEDGRQVLTLIQKIHPKVVVMDVAMPGLNGIETTHRIVSDYPEAKVIALSMYSDRVLVGRMLASGASGYLLKDCAFEELAKAIRVVAAGRTYLSSVIVDVMVKGFFLRHDSAEAAALSILTDREREILQLLSEGSSAKEIAAQLHVTSKTIETHRERIMGKLNLRSVAQLTKFAIREGLTSLDI